MTKLLRETRRTVPEVAGQLGVTAATVRFWCTRGVRGHRLEHVRLGSRFVVTAEGVERFLRATNGGTLDGQGA